MILAEKLTHIAFDMLRRSSGLARKEIKIADESSYVYLERGQGDPLLLLHGFGANNDNVTPIARFLTPRYRLIIPDLIGFGESSHPRDANYTPPSQVISLRAFMQALGVTRFHLGGSSMGGQFCLIYASLYTTDVASLWLLAPGGGWSAPKSQRQTIPEAGG